VAQPTPAGEILTGGNLPSGSVERHLSKDGVSPSQSGTSTLFHTQTVGKTLDQPNRQLVKRSSSEDPPGDASSQVKFRVGNKVIAYWEQQMKWHHGIVEEIRKVGA
jgi:hypothetical protein